MHLIPSRIELRSRLRWKVDFHCISITCEKRSLDEQEGVIKFNLEFTPGAAIDSKTIAALNAWRRIFYQLGLIGQDPKRYGGLGFGNISCRHSSKQTKKKVSSFLITGSQTAHLSTLSASHYVLVQECSVENNRVNAVGPIKPSSESLTHCAVYQCDPAVNAVVHVHNPEIWNNAEQLHIPGTDSGARYGTTEMARQIQRLLSISGSSSGVIVMKGHTDGMVAYGTSLDDACVGLIRLYQKALKYLD